MKEKTSGNSLYSFQCPTKKEQWNLTLVIWVKRKIWKQKHYFKITENVRKNIRISSKQKNKIELDNLSSTCIEYSQKSLFMKWNERKKSPRRTRQNTQVHKGDLKAAIRLSEKGTGLEIILKTVEKWKLRCTEKLD